MAESHSTSSEDWFVKSASLLGAVLLFTDLCGGLRAQEDKTGAWHRIVIASRTAVVANVVVEVDAATSEPSALREGSVLERNGRNFPITP